MSFRLLQALSPQLIADSTISDLMATSSSTNGQKDKRHESTKLVQAPEDEDMDAYLRTIRGFIPPEKLAGIFHCDLTTVYRLIDSGMPVEKGLDPLFGGRLIKIYPPQVAKWRRDRREAAKRNEQQTSGALSPNTEASNTDRAVELTSDAELNGHGPQHCPSIPKDPRL